jgi:hypothetical protein
VHHGARRQTYFVVRCKKTNKIDIYVIIALTICSLLLLPIFSSASTALNATINTSGFVQYVWTPTNKNLIAYGFSWNTSLISFVANHYSLVDCDFDYDLSAMASVKAISPDMVIIGYKDLIEDGPGFSDWATVSSQESWFVHNASGSRITTYNGEYLMNVSSMGWMQHWVSYVNSELAKNTCYNGVFADNVWNTVTQDWLGLSSPVPNPTSAGWHKATIAFLQYIKANLMSGKILVVNTEEFDTDDYLTVADGQMLEGYEHGPFMNATYVGHRPTIDCLARKSGTGKIVLADSGILTTNALQAQIDNMSNCCYASFLIGLNGSQTSYGWSQNPTGSYNTLTYPPIMDTNIGSPTDQYYSSQNVYMRDFTSGKVLFNPSSNSYTINLGGTFTLLNGTSVTSVSLAPYTGEILLSLT